MNIVTYTITVSVTSSDSHNTIQNTLGEALSRFECDLIDGGDEVILAVDNIETEVED